MEMADTRLRVLASRAMRAETNIRQPVPARTAMRRERQNQELGLLNPLSAEVVAIGVCTQYQMLLRAVEQAEARRRRTFMAVEMAAVVVASSFYGGC